MNAALQRRLAILGAIALVAVFVAANAHLIVVAFQSESRCVVPAPDKAPAMKAC